MILYKLNYIYNLSTLNSFRPSQTRFDHFRRLLSFSTARTRFNLFRSINVCLIGTSVFNALYIQICMKAKIVIIKGRTGVLQIPTKQ
jgi:hypothetical protein